MDRIEDIEAERIFNSAQKVAQEYWISLNKLVWIVNDVKNKQSSNIVNAELKPFWKPNDNEKKILNDLLKKSPAIYENVKWIISFDDNYIYIKLLDNKLKFPRKLIDWDYTHEDAIKKVKGIGARLLTKEEIWELNEIWWREYDLNIQLNLISDIFWMNKKWNMDYWTSNSMKELNEEWWFARNFSYWWGWSYYVTNYKCKILHVFN